ncbi:MAG: GntR family transcriptional regulator [Ruminococcaceae bacterium]|nr:GntR family transcriptional regulator [Oscillospiraceae bacterium]
MNQVYYCIITIVQGGDNLAWRFTTDKPVYIQISERITRSVLSGEYKSGEQIPSVRQLALEAAVNPNTVQHAFSELENDGLIISKGTLGRFVTDNKEIIETCRLRMAKKIVEDFINDMNQLSIPKNQIISIIEEASI